MEDVKLKEEPWDPAEQHSLDAPLIKEEPVEVQLQEFSFTPVHVKTEDDEDDKSRVHHRPAASNREDTNEEDCAAGCSKEKQLKVENHGGDSEEEQLRGGDSGADSEWSWDWEPPIKRSSRKLKGVRMKPECHEMSPLTLVTVKPENDDEKFGVLHRRPAARSREKTNGAGCSSHIHTDSEQQEQLNGAYSGTEEQEEDQLKGGDSGADSDWSWDWKPPRLRVQSTRKSKRGVRMAPPSPKIFYSSLVTVKNEDEPCVLHQQPAARTTEETNGEQAGCSSHLHSDSEEDVLKGADSETEEEETEERPHKCSFCGKCFKNTSHFNQHLKIHSGEKPYSCSICKKAFLRSRTLTEHMRLHTGEKPFRCSVCKNDFTSKARMKKHMKIHTGEKPFSCPFCSKCFVQRSFLVIHIRQHTGEKPYSCSLCNRSYTDKSSLRKHMKKHRTDAAFTCCGEDEPFHL